MQFFRQSQQIRNPGRTEKWHVPITHIKGDQTGYKNESRNVKERGLNYMPFFLPRYPGNEGGQDKRDQGFGQWKGALQKGSRQKTGPGIAPGDFHSRA
jgi:hypothetical protein